MSAVTLVASAAPMNEHVILLHGLCRSSTSMHRLERALTQAGYHVWNLDYPSRTNTITNLSEAVLAPALRDARSAGATRLHFVGHSLGGLLIRDYLARHPQPDTGRIVMLGPPNQGSEIVDRLGSWWLFRKINGPAGSELGTGADSGARRLGTPRVEIGIIAGNRSINWINSLLFLPGADDGKVSVERTRLEGMTDHLVLRTTHPLMMKNKTVIQQTLHFLRTGRFQR